MIPLLGPHDPFPPIERALRQPNGLLAAGGSLTVPHLIEAYRRGIFPWFSAGDPVLWWSPDPRMVLFVDEFRPSRSLAKRLRRGDYEVTADRAFAGVLQGCAQPRRNDQGTWLVPQMMRAYERLHAAGVAHSIEVWMDGALAGGLYGVALGRAFFGESMFARRTDASKIAFAHLVAQLARWAFPLIDCQMSTMHLASLGAREVSRAAFARLIEPLVGQQGIAAPWRLDTRGG
ncbi:MAG: leucyl/phenylalanyl-tRNA--protein transferase [Vicinamibacterales bacterium]